MVSAISHKAKGPGAFATCWRCMNSRRQSSAHWSVCLNCPEMRNGQPSSTTHDTHTARKRHDEGRGCALYQAGHTNAIVPHYSAKATQLSAFLVFFRNILSGKGCLRGEPRLHPAESEVFGWVGRAYHTTRRPRTRLWRGLLGFRATDCGLTEY